MWRENSAEGILNRVLSLGGRLLDAVGHPTIKDWDNGSTAVFSRASPTRQGINEDAVAIMSSGHHALVLAVADGMGGSPSGERASQLAIREIQTSLRPKLPDRDARRLAVIKGFERANQQVQGLGVGAGTTLAVLEVEDQEIRPYHVGDSLILVVGQRGKIKFQNIAHSPVGYAVESGLMDEDEAMHHRDRSVVSNIVGSTSMTVDVGPTVRLAPRDTVLLASDGLSDNLRLQEIVDHIRVGSLASVCRRLVDTASGRMVTRQMDTPSKPDDLTFAIYRPRV